MRLRLFGVCCCTALIAAFAILVPSLSLASRPQATTVLYNGALGTTPGKQGFFYYSSDPKANETFANNVTTLDTTASQSTGAGYATSALVSKPAPPLDRTVGYTVRFAVQVASETHSTNNRAGFSAIALSSDKKGIELGFWTSEIWAQSFDPADTSKQFIHGEGTQFNTAAGLVTYDLAIQGDTYTLSSNGTPIVSGPVRDYSSYNCGPDLPACPYNQANFLFFGDDTTSAGAQIGIGYVAVSSGVPATVTPTATIPPTTPHQIFLPVLAK